MKKREIIPGYKGIMDLDLTNIQEEYRENAIERHLKEIEEYKIEQKKRPQHLRYENTVERIRNEHILEDKIKNERMIRLSNERLNHNEIYNNSKI